MNETNPSTPADGVLPASGTQVELSHKEFCAGLPAGRLHLIVNPERAQKYIRHRLFVVGLALPVIAIGTALLPVLSRQLRAGAKLDRRTQREHHRHSLRTNQARP